MNFAKFNSSALIFDSELPVLIATFDSKYLLIGIFNERYNFFKKYYKSSRLPKLCAEVNVLTVIPSWII